MATLKDVARAANVDVSTVSRALNNTSHVHPDTKARIYAVAEALGYRPNFIAQALRQGRRYTIGVVVPRLHLAIFSEIVQGIEAEARKLGYSTIICTTEDDPRVELDCLNRLRNGFVDGIMIAGTGRNSRILRDLHASGIPVVQIMRKQEPRISSVVADFEACGEEAVHYLYQQGCRTIGLISGSLHLAPYQERYRGYCAAIQALALTPHLSEVTTTVNSFEYGYLCASQLLTSVSTLDAILAAVDLQGLGAIRAVTEHGLKIPQQIKIMSLTGHELGSMLETPMTSMEMPAHQMGHKAAQMLIEEIQAGKQTQFVPQHLSFPMVLVEREST